MGYKRRGRKPDLPQHWGAVGYCVCGKLYHLTKKSAKRAERLLPGGGLHVYRCSSNPNAWHVGHMPYSVRRGFTSISDHYPDPS